MSAVMPLLATKLYIPRARPAARLVPRPRLVSRLNVERPLTLICAPAGFGKTTLLSEWIPHSERCVCWVSLDEADNDPVRFWTYSIAALQLLQANLGQDALALLQFPQPPPIEPILTPLLNDIALFRDRFALVLDDYHVITTQAIHDSVAFLLDHLPPHVQVIITSRIDPMLPLARLRARGQLTELRAADLRFTADEASAFLNGVMGLNLSADDIAALEHRTEGWIAGLHLAALSMQGNADRSSFIAAFTGSNRYILDYLVDEVLNRRPKGTLNFLLQSSILERLNGSLCDAVTGQSDSRAILEQLEHANLFIVPLDEERQWYRYHHLFAEVLRARLRRTQPDLTPVLNRRASVWHEQNGLMIEAVNYALAAGDPEHTGRLIENASDVVMRRGQVRTLLDWLNLLPDALVRARPGLCILHAAALINTNQPEAAQARLQTAEQGVQPDMATDQTQIILGQVATLRGGLARVSGDLSGSVALSRQALDLLPETPTMARASALVNAAHVYKFGGDVTLENESLAVAAAARARASGNPFIFLLSVANLAQMHVLQGQLRRAATTYGEMLQMSLGEAGLQAMVGGASYYFGLGDVLREWNDLNEAERHLTRGRDLVKGMLTVDADVVTQGYSALARLMQARGDGGSARAILAEFAQLAEQRHFFPGLITRGAAAQAALALAQGDFAAALRWVEMSGLSAADDKLPYPRESEYLTLARVLIAQSKCEEVLHLLDRLLQDSEVKARMGSAIEILMLRALALQKQGNAADAVTALERALTLAEPEGYVRVFVDEGEPMKLLIADCRFRIEKQATHLQSYVGKLLAAFPNTGLEPDALKISNPTGTLRSQKSTIKNLIEPLSERELEVLRLIEAGLTNQAIAQKLVVAISTVKKHINSLYGKLNVQSRTQALARARELNLL